MPSFQPYQNSYYSRKRKRQILIVVLAASTLVMLILLLSNPGKKPDPVESTAIGQSDNLPTARPEPVEKKQTESGLNRDRTNRDMSADSDLKPETNQLSTEPDSPPEEPKPEAAGDEWESDVDRKREQGLLDFEEAIQQCQNKLQQINELQAEYDINCTGTSFDAYGNPVVNATTPQCRKLQARISQLQSQLTKELAQAKYRARKAGLYPGQIRDILERYNFQE